VQSIDDAKILPVLIPEVPGDATFKHHPIVRTPNFYKPEELADVGTANTEWMTFFEQILCGLYWKLGGPVPYAFRTYDGTFRKLDAGCLKFLANRNPPEIKFCPDDGGFINSVMPSPELLERHESDKPWLITMLDIP